MSISKPLGGAIAATLLCLPLLAQQPRLSVQPVAFSRTQPSAILFWQLFGRQGDIFGVLVDHRPGPAMAFGGTFDLGFTPNLFLLDCGVLGPFGANGAVPFAPDLMPPTTLHLQAGMWDPTQGFPSLLVSTNASVIVHDGPMAISVDFDWYSLPPLDGSFDRSVSNRLQASPPMLRTAHALPPLSYPFFFYGSLTPLHPSGARTQMVLRASELGANGLPEELVSVRWRPLFGVVATETFPQFELRAAHTQVVPDFTLDPFSALPVAPTSGLQTSFASNPTPGTTPQTLYSGPYSVQASALLPNGYLPFPTPQQPFRYNGQSSLLLETLCAPAPGLGLPQNQQTLYLQVLSSEFPYATVAAVAGLQGQPTPLQPAAATSGTGGAYLWDWELEFRRTTSQAVSPWQPAFVPFPDYLPPIAATSSLPGTSILIEFRGSPNAQGDVPTPWSTNPDIADGQAYLQYRITLTADPVTGATPWVDSLVIPYQ